MDSCLMPLAGDRRCMMAYVLTTATDRMQQTEGNSRLLPTAHDTTAKGRGTSAQLQQADSNSSMHIPPTAYVTIATGQGTSGQIQQAGINSSIHIPPTAYVTIATGRGTYAQIQQAEISSNINMRPTSCVTSATGWGTYAQLPITKWPRQSGAPVGAAPPTRSQLRLQRHTQVPVQN